MPLPSTPQLPFPHTFRYNRLFTFHTDDTMSQPLLHEKLNTETARIAWEELQPHFARGAAVYVAPDLDLVEIARHMAEDRTAALAPLMEQGKFGVVNEDQARAFLAVNQEMWAVVVAPWVLVQPCRDDT